MSNYNHISIIVSIYTPCLKSMVIENSELKLLPPSLITRPSYFGNILAALVGVQPGSGYETSCRPQEGVRDLPAQRGPYLVLNWAKYYPN